MFLDEGVPLERRRQRVVPLLKHVILLLLARLVGKRLQLGTDMLVIITSTGDGIFLDLSTSMTLNDLEPTKEG